MALLLCIDTALETATIALCNEVEVIDFCTHSDPKNSASFVQPAIQSIMLKTHTSFENIDAVAVVNGPGSYTGLRVGLASAKGICYAAKKPLILLNTLQVMAMVVIEEKENNNALYCPMIDARRNEVFTAVYDAFLNPVLPSQPLIIERSSFATLLSHQQIYFFGSGHNKCEKIVAQHQNASFISSSYSLRHMNKLAQNLYEKGWFEDIAYAEPFYLKEFYSPLK